MTYSQIFSSHTTKVQERRRRRMTRITQRDQEILRQILAEQIDALRPLTQMDGWQATFAREADRWQAIGNGRRDGSEEQSEAYGWASAHRLLIEEKEETDDR